MFQGLKSKLDDMGAVKRLCERAEAYALQDQQRQPGAEHFLLAALDLPDGTARHAFEQAGAEPDALRAAIDQQYADALRGIGLIAETPTAAPLPTPSGPYQAAASGQAVMQALAATRKSHSSLLGAHVVAVVADMSEGVAPRALRALGVDLARLKSTADAIAQAGHTR
ncbi:Clp protease N-terminal domain-containing protein [Brevundimonas faecalis]|uniref:Clp protease N-terminal domain-containing protein n=1 Tax=Brevundimonas faecalis TaxID=947378 RepID=UPI00360A38F2